MSSTVRARGANVAVRGARRCPPFLSALTIVCAVVLGLGASSSASATVGHSFANQFGGGGTGDGQFNGGPNGVAVLPSTNDVYVLDAGHTLVDGVTPDPRVERFDDAGVFQDAFSIGDSTYTSSGSIAIDPSGGGAVYTSLGDPVTNMGAVFKYSLAGAFVHALDVGSSGTTINNNALIAIDPIDGTIYALASNGNGQVIDAFDGATGAFLRSFDGTNNSPDGGLICPNTLAVDPSHSVYVVDPCKNRVDRYTSVGDYDATIDDGSRGGPTAITIDPTSGETFVSEYGTAGIQVVSYSGTTRGQVFDASMVANVAGLAVNPGSGTIYVADNGNTVVHRFTAFDGPTVTTDAASPVAVTSATLNGTVDPGGIAATYHFEYGLDTTYGTSTAGASAGSGTSAIPLTAALTGLTPNQTYHYRIVGTNVGGSITGDDRTFTTGSIPPTITGAPFTSSTTPTTVRVQGAINPNHRQTVWHVDYGPDANYGVSSSDADAGSGTSDKAVNLILTSLQPATTYHYRITADNGTGGAQHGPDGTFTTAPAAPATATDVTTSRAMLAGTIDPHGVATTYHFEYGLTMSYGKSTPEADGGTSSGERTVTAAITGLAPSTIYHVRVVATSGSNTWSGADGTFTTPSAPASTASAVTGVGTSTATLNGTVDTHGAAGTYQFEVSSLGSAYALVTPERSLGAAVGARGVTEAVSGLPAGELFTVRLVSSSQDGIGYSDQVTFATAPLPRTFPAPPAPAATGAYGCAAPRLDAYNKKPSPGDVITITGSDLGVGGTVSLGDASPTPADWTSTGFSVTVPDDATGTLPLTVNCRKTSNTVAVTIFHAPSNAFSITKSSVSGTMAKLSVKVPGPGKVETSGSRTAAIKRTVAKASTVTIAVKLSTAGKKALAKAKSRKLKVSMRVRFTPAGGTAASKTLSVTFTRKDGR